MMSQRFNVNKSDADHFEHNQKFFGKSLRGFAATEQPKIFSVSEGAANRSKRPLKSRSDFGDLIPGILRIPREQKISCEK